MRRFIVVGAVVLLVLAAAVPLTNASATPVTTAVTKHVDGSITTSEKCTDHVWIARFEVRTTPAGVVQFGYLELYGIGGDAAGQIHEFTFDSVTYFKTASGAPGATCNVREWRIVPGGAFVGSGGGVYTVTDGSSVGQPDTFVPSLYWTILSGNISIYTTSDQNSQW